MSIFGSMDISSTGLSAQRLRMDAISNNIANVNTTRTSDGEPYRRTRLIFEEIPNKNFRYVLSNKIKEVPGRGVRVVALKKDDAPFKMVYDPTHPDADDSCRNKNR
jgi:flagellar basal-body rod protein FlgC